MPPTHTSIEKPMDKSLSQLAAQLSLGGMTTESTKPGAFPKTRWSLVVHAQGGDLAEDQSASSATSALESLCAAYWKPIYAYVRRSGFGVEDAEDITQDFIAWFIAKDHLAEVDPSKGRLRSYFLAVLRRYVADQRRRVNALKRGGKQQIISIDQREAEHGYDLLPADSSTPDEAFEKRWALSLMEGAIAKLRDEHLRKNNLPLFEVLSPFLQNRPDPRSYDEAASTLGTSVAAIKMQVHRMRKRFGELFRHEVMQTLDSTSDLDEELSHVRSLFER